MVLLKLLYWIYAFKASTQCVKYSAQMAPAVIVAVWSVISFELANNLIVVPPGPNKNHGRVEQ